MGYSLIQGVLYIKLWIFSWTINICSYLPTLKSLIQGKAIHPSRAQPDWAYEFPDRTGPDTQIYRTGHAGPD